MAKKYFYSHIVATEDISLALGDLDMPAEDRVRLINLAHENLHHAILDTVLDSLSEDEKKEFLLHISRSDHQKAWGVLKKIENVEDKILEIAKKVKKEMHEDIKKASK